MRALSKPDSYMGILLFSILSVILFMAAIGITSTNDAAHYVLTRAIVRDHTLTVDPYQGWMYMDKAKRNGHFYSDRAPALAFTAVPLYAIASKVSLFPKPENSYISGSDRKDRGIFAVVLISIFSAAGVAWLAYNLLRRAGVSVGAAVVTALASVFATTLFRYGSNALSHAYTTFLAFAAVALVIQMASRPCRLQALQCALLSFILVWACFVEYGNVTLLAAIGIVVLVRLVRGDLRLSILSCISAAIAGLVAATPGLIYHHLAFGSPFTTGYKYKVGYQDVVSSMPKMFAMPFWKGLLGNWLGYYDPSMPYARNVGLLSRFPVLIFGLVGLIFAARSKQLRPLFVPAIVVVAVWTIFYSKYSVFEGGTFDSRFMTCAAAFTALGIAPVIDWINSRAGKVSSELLRALLYILLGVSVYMSLLAHANGLGYLWNPQNLLMERGYQAMDYIQVGSWTNWKYLFDCAFPNADNWYRILLPLAIVWAIWFAVRRSSAAMASQRPEPVEIPD